MTIPHPSLARANPTGRSRSLIFLLCLLSAALSPVILHGAESESSEKTEKITLPKLTVKGDPVCSFGIGIVGTREPKTRRVQRLFISSVAEGSTAEQIGLKEGDEILSINGQKVAGMDGEIKRGSWLFDQLADQDPGKTLDLEVAVRVVKKLTLRATNLRALGKEGLLPLN